MMQFSPSPQSFCNHKWFLYWKLSKQLPSSEEVTKLEWQLKSRDPRNWGKNETLWNLPVSLTNTTCSREGDVTSLFLPILSVFELFLISTLNAWGEITLCHYSSLVFQKNKIVFLLLTRANRSRFVLIQGAGRCDSLQHPSARITLPSVPMLQQKHVHGLCHASQLYKQQLVSVHSFQCYLKLGIAISKQHGLYKQGTWTWLVAFLIFFHLYRWA